MVRFFMNDDVCIHQVHIWCTMCGSTHTQVPYNSRQHSGIMGDAFMNKRDRVTTRHPIKKTVCFATVAFLVSSKTLLVEIEIYGDIVQLRTGKLLQICHLLSPRPIWRHFLHFCYKEQWHCRAHKIQNHSANKFIKASCAHAVLRWSCWSIWREGPSPGMFGQLRHGKC